MKSLIIAILAIIAVTISTTSCVKLSEEVSIERIELPAIEVDSIYIPPWDTIPEPPYIPDIGS